MEPEVTVKAFDKRELQGGLRGDSLLGAAELQLDAAQLGQAPQRKVGPGERRIRSWD